jgi:hypothetical protein
MLILGPLLVIVIVIIAVMTSGRHAAPSSGRGRRGRGARRPGRRGGDIRGGAGDALPRVPGSTPASSERQWHYGDQGQPRGPVPESELIRMLRNRTIAPGTLVWSKGMSEWKAAESVEGLRGRV